MKRSESFVAVVIPLYRVELSEFEKISLAQCLKVLHKHPIVIVGPKYIDAMKILPRPENNNQISYLRFHNDFFRNIESYNELLLSEIFYSSLANYKYILIYQLDAFVFDDQLEYWCNSNYDYIGAPWFEGYGQSNSHSQLLPLAGNGGFSLRRVEAHLRVLRSRNNRAINGFDELIKEYSEYSFFMKIMKLPELVLKAYGYPNTAFYFKRLHRNEDGLWVQVANKISCEFTVADAISAISFSFECQPRRLFEFSKKLPFGCHGWASYDIAFWRPYFAEYGYQI